MAKEGAGGGGGRSGIGFHFVFDAADTLQVWRDTSSGYGTRILVAELTGGEQDWFDWTALPGTPYYYQWQAVRGIQVSSLVNHGAPTAVMAEIEQA